MEAKALYCFQVTMPDKYIALNSMVSLNLTKLNQNSVLHPFDQDTKCNTAYFLNGDSMLQVRHALLWIRITTHVGFPETLAPDEGPQFCSDEWYNLTHNADIFLHFSEVEAHNAIGSRERYHSFLCWVFHKFQWSTSGLPDEIALALAMKTCNSTAGPNSLLPTLLVFGVSSEFRSVRRGIQATLAVWMS